MDEKYKHITSVPIGMRINQIEKKPLENICIWYQTKECQKSGLDKQQNCTDGYKKCFAYVPNEK